MSARRTFLRGAFGVGAWITLQPAFGQSRRSSTSDDRVVAFDLRAPARAHQVPVPA